MFLVVYLQKASDTTSRILLLNTLVHVDKLRDVHFFLKFFHVLLLLTPLACSPTPTNCQTRNQVASFVPTIPGPAPDGGWFHLVTSVQSFLLFLHRPLKESQIIW